MYAISTQPLTKSFKHWNCKWWCKTGMFCRW